MTMSRCCPGCGREEDLHQLLPAASGLQGLWPASYMGIQPSAPDPIHPIFARADKWSCQSCGWEGWGWQLQRQPTATQEAEQCFREQARRRTNEPGGSESTGKAKPLPPGENRPEQEPPPSSRDQSSRSQMVEHRTARLTIYVLPHRRQFLQSEADVRQTTVTQLVEVALAEWLASPGEVPKASGGVRVDLVLTPSHRGFLERQALRRTCSVSSLVNEALTCWVHTTCPDVAGLW